MNDRSSPFEADTLDPADWSDDRAAGHAMLEDLIDYLQTIRDRPAWQPMPQASQMALREPPPFQGASLAAVFDEFKQHVMPYGLGNIHPRFWGWVIGTGSLAGVFADMIVSAMNTNAAGFQTSASFIENEVIGWWKEVVGFPQDASGAMTTGGSVANFECMAAALYSGRGAAVRQHGLRQSDYAPVVYTSTQAHFSIVRAARLLGIGEANVRKIGVNDRYQIDVAELTQAIRRDRDAGLHPAIIAAHTGTVGVGAFDPLEELAHLAAAEGLWLHVDAAFGGCVLLHDELRERGAGLGAVDSVAIDLHKWLHVPIDAACTLVRDPHAHRTAFGIDAPYLADLTDGPAVDSNRYTNLGVQQSRSARALKTWFLLKHFGLRQLGQMVYKNVRQAEWLGRLLESADDFELLAPVQLNIVCFRYRCPHAAEAELDDLNRDILLHLHVEGHAIPSPFRVDGKFAIRCAFTNHRTTDDDLLHLIRAIRAFADPAAAPR